MYMALIGCLIILILSAFFIIHYSGSYIKNSDKNDYDLLASCLVSNMLFAVIFTKLFSTYNIFVPFYIIVTTLIMMNFKKFFDYNFIKFRTYTFLIMYMFRFISYPLTFILSRILKFIKI